MSDETQAVTPEAQAADGQQAEQEQPKTEGTAWPAEALAKIKELNAEAAKYRKEREAARKQAEEVERKAAEEQGQYKELYEKAQAKLAELEPAQARLEELIAATQAANEKRLAAIPEAMRTLVPDYDDPLKLAAWLDANSAVFAKPTPPALDARAGGGNGAATVTDAEVQAWAVRMNVSPEHVDRAALAKALGRR